VSTEVPFFDLGALVAGRRNEIEGAIATVLNSGQFVGGSAVAEFEAGFAAYLGVPHCVAVGNGLDALRISLECAGIGPGDEVIVPGFTFYATWLAVMQTGATPVPIDVRLTTASIDVALLEEALSERTRAILPVHLYGIAAEMAGIDAFAARHGLTVIEDVAQAHGARDDLGRLAGTSGAFGAFSFYPTKNLGALGDAGALVTSEAVWAEKARSRRSYGQGATKYEHVDTGWNSRMDPIQAGVLCTALRRLDTDNDRRREIARRYRDALDDALHATVAPARVEDSVWHHFVLRASDRSALRVWFKDRGVNTDIHYPYAFNGLEVIRRLGVRETALPQSISLAQSVVSLPMGPWMSDVQVEIVVDALRVLPRELLAPA